MKTQLKNNMCRNYSIKMSKHQKGKNMQISQKQTTNNEMLTYFVHIDPLTVVETICSGDVQLSAQTYIIKDENDKLQKEKEKLENTITTLELQIKENVELRIKLQLEVSSLTEQNKQQSEKIRELTEQNTRQSEKIRELTEKNNCLELQLKELHERNDYLESQIKDLQVQNEQLIWQNKESNAKMSLISEQLDRLITKNNKEEAYRKFSDGTTQIFDVICDSLCSENSEVYAKSRDNSVYVLCRHLRELDGKIMTKKIKDDPQKWKMLREMVCEILKNEFNIEDINVFYELVALRGERNSFSHNSEHITFDELQSITPYAEELWKILH